MKNYYVTCLIIKGDFKKNVKHQVEALSREYALTYVVADYIGKGFEVVKSRVIEL